MIRYSILTLLLLFVGCGTPAAGPGTLSLNWFPEAEHGGFFQAVNDAKGEAPYLIEAGGPDVPVLQKVAAGKSDFGVANADDVVNAQAQGADVVALMAPLFTHPRCIMVRKDSGVKAIGEISNMTLAMSSRPAFSHWLRHKYPFEGVKVVPYPGSILPFTQDPKFAQQAYSISEPFLAKSKGVEPVVLMVSELGFNPYGSVLIVRRELIEKEPERVRKVVVASQRGWQVYLQGGEEAHKKIHSLNPEMGIDILDYGHTEMKKLIDPKMNQPFGTMVADRWETLIAQMVECGLIKTGKVKAQDCFTNQFLE
jgi:NitT/TauT family transport system substrate-binding protein